MRWGGGVEREFERGKAESKIDEGALEREKVEKEVRVGEVQSRRRGN